MRVTLLTVTPNGPIIKFLLLVPTTCTLLPGGLSSREKTASTRTHMIPLNWKLRLLLRHFGLLIPLNQQAKNIVTALTGVFDLGYQGEIGLLLHKRVKECLVHGKSFRAFLCINMSCD